MRTIIETNTDTEINVPKGQEITYITLNTGKHSKKANIGENGMIRWIAINRGELKIETELTGKNAKAESIELNFGTTIGKVTHKATGTQSLVACRSIGGKATSCVRIEAEDCSSTMEMHSLLHGNIQPEMEILKNATAKHKASVHEMMPDEEYYMQTRGLTKEEATKEYENGFLLKVLQMLNEKERNVVEKWI